MDKHDEYRKHAQEAQEMAAQARNEDDRASWLRIARQWLQMIPQSQQEPSKKAEPER